MPQNEGNVIIGYKKGPWVGSGHANGLREEAAIAASTSGEEPDSMFVLVYPIM